jgi:hypothetical protein
MRFDIAAEYVAAQAANNILVIALSNGRILRIDLNRPEDIDGARPRPNASSTKLTHPVRSVSCRHRSPQEALRDGRHPPPLPRPHCLAPAHLHRPRRDLLPALAVAAPARPGPPARGRPRGRRLVARLTHLVDPRDPPGCRRRQRLRGLH